MTKVSGLFLSVLLVGFTQAANSSTVKVNVSSPTIVGPAPGQTAYLVSVSVLAGAFDTVGKTFDVLGAGMVTGGYYYGQSTLSVNLCDTRNCSGQIVISLGQVSLGNATEYGYPLSFRFESNIATVSKGTQAYLTSTTEAESNFGGGSFEVTSNSTLPKSQAVDLTKAYYVVLAWYVNPSTQVTGSPQITTSLLRLVVH